MLSERERITLLMMRGWGDNRRSYNNVKQLLNENFRNEKTAISKSTVVRTVQRFEETGTVKNRPKSGRPLSTTTPQQALNVLKSFIEDPRNTLCKVGMQHDIDHKSVHKILKQNHFHPYKVYLTQELNDNDFDRRIKFCEIMMERIDAQPEFLTQIVFNDEATFTLYGNVNRHNCRYWSDANPHWMVEARTQYPQKLNVWTGILNNTLIGPFFIDGNLNAEQYENMLRNQIVPAIIAKVGENFEHIWFQQDGAPPHYSRNVRRYLNTVFIERWIGRRGTIEWPARSPDLSPLDYFLWGYLKAKVYATQPLNLEDL